MQDLFQVESIVSFLRQKMKGEMKKDKTYNRRAFIDKGVRLTLGLSVVATGAMALSRRTGGEEYVWQIDPFKCTQCGRCATECVMAESAVKCVHAYDLCGYCDLCGGYFKPGAKLQTGAENQLCPTAAIQRKFIEEPYFEYIIDEKLCIGCAKVREGLFILREWIPSFADPARPVQKLQPVRHCKRLSLQSHQQGAGQQALYDKRDLYK